MTNMNCKRMALVLLVCIPVLCQARKDDNMAGWVSTDVHHALDSKPSFQSKAFEIPAWKGETVNAEAAVWSPEGLSGLQAEASALKSGKNIIPADAVSAKLVSPVIGDELAPGFNQCGKRNKEEWTPVVNADIIGMVQSSELAAGGVQAIWLSVKVPCDAAPGSYVGTVTLSAEGWSTVLKYKLTVVDRLLPPASDWPFHLDLWQNPYAVARVAGVPLWSKAHFAAMDPVMKRLAAAGQKVITATIMDRPWNGQTEDPFGPMVTKVLKADGSWWYDYTVFDMWVEYMMSLGIDSQINCYTLIPWKQSFDYYNQAANQVEHVDTVAGSDEYNAYWGAFLADFASHLKAKGWFGKTMIAMDERGEEAMKAALKLIKGIDPDFKVALAGSYHESIADSIDDLCIGFMDEYPDGVVERRRSAGKVTTYYTCCAEGYPNTFIDSVPAEASWLPLVALAKDVDGYLRWAYNSWTENPFEDARFRTWAAGDTYMVYPGGVTGIRFEKLLEGLQTCEKAVLLRKEWNADASKAANLQKLEDAISRFNYLDITENGPVPALKQVRAALAL